MFIFHFFFSFSTVETSCPGPDKVHGVWGGIEDLRSLKDGDEGWLSPVTSVVTTDAISTTAVGFCCRHLQLGTTATYGQI